MAAWSSLRGRWKGAIWLLSVPVTLFLLGTPLLLVPLLRPIDVTLGTRRLTAEWMRPLPIGRNLPVRQGIQYSAGPGGERMVFLGMGQWQYLLLILPVDPVTRFPPTRAPTGLANPGGPAPLD